MSHPASRIVFVVALVSAVLAAPFSAFTQSGPPLAVSQSGAQIDPLDLLSFPDTEVGHTSNPIEFTVRNVGEADLTLPKERAVALTDGETEMFVITSQPGSTLAIHERARFSVAFKPTSIGEKSATVTITSSDPDYPTFSFEVAGNGIVTPAH